MLTMESPEQCKMRVRREEGPDLEVPVNLNIYCINLLPYILRLKAGFYLFVSDTWIAYNDQVLTIAETFNTWRILVYLNQIMQLIYAFELFLLMIQGLFGLIQAYRIFKKFSGKDNHRVPQFEHVSLCGYIVVYLILSNFHSTDRSEEWLLVQAQQVHHCRLPSLQGARLGLSAPPTLLDSRKSPKL